MKKTHSTLITLSDTITVAVGSSATQRWIPIGEWIWCLLLTRSWLRRRICLWTNTERELRWSMLEEQRSRSCSSRWRRKRKLEWLRSSRLNWRSRSGRRRKLKWPRLRSRLRWSSTSGCRRILDLRWRSSGCRRVLDLRWSRYRSSNRLAIYLRVFFRLGTKFLLQCFQSGEEFLALVANSNSVVQVFKLTIDVMGVLDEANACDSSLLSFEARGECFFSNSNLKLKKTCVSLLTR